MRELTPSQVPPRSRFNWLKKISTSNFWQAAFVRPFPPGRGYAFKRFKGLLAYGFGLAFVWGASGVVIDDVLRRPIDLDQMEIRSGTLTAVGAPTRATPSFILREPNGNEIRYTVDIYKALELKKSLNTVATVWSQKGFHPLAGIVERPYEIRLDNSGKYLFEYQKYRDQLIRFDERDHLWALGILFLGLFFVTRPWWRHRNPASQFQQVN